MRVIFCALRKRLPALSSFLLQWQQQTPKDGSSNPSLPFLLHSGLKNKVLRCCFQLILAEISPDASPCFQHFQKIPQLTGNDPKCSTQSWGGGEVIGTWQLQSSSSSPRLSNCSSWQQLLNLKLLKHYLPCRTIEPGKKKKIKKSCGNVRGQTWNLHPSVVQEK